jgi:UDP-MurNAc hydroxylase
MKITFLGHAGFFIETSKTLLIMDAWVSKNGAFDGGWFQYPKNHHMAGFLEKKLHDNKNEKDVYVYVSHEHKDHFDISFLKSIDKFNFKYVIPSFRRTLLEDQIRSFSEKELIICDDNHLIKLNENEFVKIFTDDSELNRDSAILFTSNGKKFLNLNDCKIHDRLGLIKKEEGEIDVFAVQFSGATWHPTCYEYTQSDYEQISKKKKRSKFEATAVAIELVKPKVYIPSAGPACFLDPDLIHINFQQHNIFPRDTEVIKYLDRRLRKIKPVIYGMFPEDSIEISKDILYKEGPLERIDDDNFKNYITQYAEEYKDFFKKIKQPIIGHKYSELKNYIIKEFQNKLDNFKSRIKIERPLYFEFIDQTDSLFKIDFQQGKVEEVNDILEEDFYKIKSYSYDIERIKDRHITWEDYSLTFRMKLNREPDVYQVLMQGFLILEIKDLNFFCDKILEIENRTERITVEVNGCKYRIDRFCPHQGADLKHAWFEGKHLVCPRHRWEFDIENGGDCMVNLSSLNAIPLDED